MLGCGRRPVWATMVWAVAGIAAGAGCSDAMAPTRLKADVSYSGGGLASSSYSPPPPVVTTSAKQLTLAASEVFSAGGFLLTAEAFREGGAASLNSLRVVVTSTWDKNGGIASVVFADYRVRVTGIPSGEYNVTLIRKRATGGPPESVELTRRLYVP